MKITKTINHTNKGSLLIWSVLLGFLLTSVFFFFSVRQRAAIAIQQDTAQILNTRQYLESYADYVQNLPEAELGALKSSGISYDGITGTVTNVVGEIVGVADVGMPVEYKFAGDIFIEWNKCSNNLKGSMYVKDASNEILYEHDSVSVPECLPFASGYDDLIGPIAVTNPFIISTLNAPFHYHITPKDASTKLIDNKWHLDIKKDLDYGKKIEVKRVF